MYILALTGGIASGKSAVSDMIIDMGITVVDADKISREIMQEGSPILDKVKQEFGEDVFYEDGTLDRKALGRIVFSNKQMLDRLNEITHPEIYKRINNRIEECRQRGESLCVLDVPVLIESKGESIADGILLVYADEQTQLARLMKRDNITADYALRKIQSQMSFEEKRRYADYIIDNSGSLQHTRDQLEHIINSIRHLEEGND